MHELFWDFETRSAANLPNCGAWRYAADPTTAVICLNFAVDDGEIETWLPTWVTEELGLPEQPIPAPFHAIAAEPSAWRTIAHNAEFERAMHECVLVQRYGFPPIPLECQHCTMTLALANAYPAELELLAQALGLEYQKDLEGVRLMRAMSRPRKPHKGEDKNVVHWLFDLEKLQRLVRYGQQDVLLARAAWHHPKLRPLIEAVGLCRARR
jgi:DNA polymerase bacteriophage-type